MGNHQSSPAEICLGTICANRQNCIAYPNDPFYQINWVKPYNLDVPVTPTAVIRPETAKDVAAVVKCAKQHGLHVQARSGGHSYGNLGLGGEDGVVVVDLVKMDSFSMDTKTWNAKIGSGMQLAKLDEHLHKNGGRAMAHGTCPGVGIGGHATVGGLGPMSRMWGNALDHIVEVEVVTADGKIQRASEKENSDLFWAIRGAGASFGIVTEFVARTHPEPGKVVEYTYSLHFGTQKEMASVYRGWQKLISDPEMDRRFSSIFIAQPLGAIITGTFYGTEDEFKASGILEQMPGSKPGLKDGALLTDWLGSLTHQAEVEGLALSNLATAFYSKSLAFRDDQLLDDNSIDELFRYVGDADRGTIIWALLFNSEGGAVADTPAGATAYPHRDKIMMYQSYAVGIPKVSKKTREFVEGVHSRIQRGAPTAKTAYAGYIDTAINRTAAQELYWGEQLPRLREVKRKWDPNNVFWNTQSVDPADG